MQTMIMAKFLTTVMLSLMLHRVSSIGFNGGIKTMLYLMETAYLEKNQHLGAEDGTNSDFHPQVQTTSGHLYGSKNSHANSFYGIPYAIHPTENLRFRPPQMLETPERVRNVTVARQILCAAPGDAEQTEDCLVINVHVPLHVDLSDPEAPPSDRLPVMFFIHGGACFIGSGTWRLYEGRFLSEATNTIVVTVNYRLGPLGFLVFDDGEHTIDGNQGLKDQQLAMQWVQNNIEKFGGDKKKVTIFGESAGAQSVMFHLLSNTSGPLFHQAIMESNPARYTYPTRDEALAVTDELIGLLRCKFFSFNWDCCRSWKDGYTCLMEASTERLVDAMLEIMSSKLLGFDLQQAIEPFRPYIDGVEFKMQPVALFKRELWNKHKPLIIGSNEEELDALKDVLWLNRFLYRGLNQLYFEDLGDKGDIISDKYEQTYPNITSYTSLLGMEMTDFWFGCPSRTMARFISETSEAPVYYYIFGHSQDGEDCEDRLGVLCGYSFHASELPFVFGTVEHVGLVSDNDDVLVSNQFSRYFGNFAWTGNPSKGPVSSSEVVLPTWTRYTTNPDKNFSTNLRFASPEAYLEQNYRGQICDFWESLDILPQP